jgi:hypothetical protein
MNCESAVYELLRFKLKRTTSNLLWLKCDRWYLISSPNTRNQQVHIQKNGCAEQIGCDWYRIASNEANQQQAGFPIWQGETTAKPRQSYIKESNDSTIQGYTNHREGINNKSASHAITSPFNKQLSRQF